MQMLTEYDGNIAILAPQVDNLGYLTANQLSNWFKDEAPSNSPVVLDMDKINFVDSAGFGGLILCRRNIRAKGGDLLLCALNPQVERTFRDMGLNRIFPAHATRPEALKAARLTQSAGTDVAPKTPPPSDS